MEITDADVLSKFEQDVTASSVVPKRLGNRTIYPSRPLPFSLGPPILSDMSEARFGEVDSREDIMPAEYRSPEVILGMKWTFSVDIWAVAMLVMTSHSAVHLF